MSMHDDASGSLDEIGRRDHAVTSEYRIFGPPGTGKTTNVARQIQLAVAKFGPTGILATSFSRAAATELVGRGLPLDRDRVGTLHSHCFHALNSPQIAEPNVADWNRSNPHQAITPVDKNGRFDSDDAGEDDTRIRNDGDRHLADLNRLRGMLIPRENWPFVVRQFEARWSEYKRANDLLDFTDLIDNCLRDMSIAPGNPSVIFADESQDLNPMQLLLLRKWGRHTEYFILAGDDDQTIYGFSGASPEAILNPDIPDDHKIILTQSYRVPRVIHHFADKLIRQVARRQEKAYRPRSDEGELHRLTSGTYKSPEYFILKTANEHLKNSKSVMFLASCSYMLQPIIAVLRKNGLPFHNPYRRNKEFWNPIRLGKAGSSANRVLALLAAHPHGAESSRPWTHGELGAWTEWLTDGMLMPDARTFIASREATMEVSLIDLVRVFRPAALESLMAAYDGSHQDLLLWWLARLRPEAHDRARYLVDVAIVGGRRAVYEPPTVVVGTIHSVKGGQADVVYLFPDLSRSGDAAYNGSRADHDSVIRLFYVAATRAKEVLYICQRETATSIYL